MEDPRTGSTDRRAAERSVDECVGGLPDVNDLLLADLIAAEDTVFAEAIRRVVRGSGEAYAAFTSAA